MSIWENPCMSSPFPIGILNDIFFFERRSSPCFSRSFVYQNLIIIPRNSYWYRKTKEGLKVFRLFGAISLLEYILLIKEQIARVSRWFLLKKYIVKMFLFSNRSRNLFFTAFTASRNLLLYCVCATLLTWCNRWIVSFVDTICNVWKIITKK